jgi:bacillithiol biosynthesis cysteine-adding enzyme BshC
MTEERIAYQDMPGFPALFNAFTSDFSRAAAFFPGDPRSDDDVARTAESRLKTAYARKALADILLAQNRQYGVYTAVEENIRTFRDSGDALVMFTGQQPGLLTGPLYTIYKILTVIVAAREYTETLNIPVIPCFWIQGEDHNLREISRVSVSVKKSLARFDAEAYFPAGNKAPGGGLSLEKVLPDLLAYCQEQFGRKTHGTEALALISRAATAHWTVTGFFGAIISGLFGPHGLVLVDPLDPGIKTLAAPMIKKIFLAQRNISQAMAAGDSVLQDVGFEPQIKKDEQQTLVMEITERGRTALFMRGDRVIARGFDRVMPAGEVANRMDESPEHFGPNVLSRPLVQDALFPTLAYAAGPSELCYLGQVMPLYQLMDVPMPLIIPRAGFTLVDQGVARSLDALGLAPSEGLLSGDIRPARQEKTGRASETALEWMKEKGRTVEKDLQALFDRAVAIDPGGEKRILKIRESMSYQLSRLLKGTEAASEAGDEKFSRHVATVRNSLRPDGKLQERVLNWFQYHAAYGEDILTLLMNRIDFRDFRHVVLPVAF